MSEFIPHPMNELWKLQLANVKSEAIVTGLKLGIFDALTQPRSVDELATLLALEPFYLELLLKGLWSLELITQDENQRYQNSELAQHNLVKQSGHYCGDSLLFRHKTYASFAKVLSDQIRSGKHKNPFESAPSTAQWKQGARLQLAQEQRIATNDIAKTIMHNLPEFSQAKRLLDLGAGPGLISLTLAQSKPDLHVTLFDLAPPLEVAQENFADSDVANIAQRSEFIAGNFVDDDLVGESQEQYDIIWCSSIFYFSPHLPDLLAKLYQSLKPNGVLVSLHSEQAEDPARLQDGYFYYLPLLMRGHEILPEGELTDLLTQQGFTNIESFEVPSMPLSPAVCHLARKPA